MLYGEVIQDPNKSYTTRIKIPKYDEFDLDFDKWIEIGLNSVDKRGNVRQNVVDEFNTYDTFRILIAHTPI